MTDYTDYGVKLWEPGKELLNQSYMAQFIDYVNQSHHLGLTGYPELHQWSVSEMEKFWNSLASFCTKVCPELWFQSPNKAVEFHQEMGQTQFFPGATLNYARSLLSGINAAHKGDRSAVVVTSYLEGQRPRNWSIAALETAVASVAAYLKQCGVGKGDRVAGIVANTAESLIAMLATTSLGGIWSSCSPDFGERAVVDRFGQIEPKVIFATASYQYNQKTFHCRESVVRCVEQMPSVQNLVFINLLPDDLSNQETGKAAGKATGKTASAATDHPPPPAAITDNWERILTDYKTDHLEFTPTAFDDPLYIMFSSGTTGVPKCIVHGAGGTLLQHMKELLLHSNVGPQSKLFFFTTCGWMMWNWTVSALATGASLVLYDGSVTTPSLNVLWDIVATEAVTAFGTSPKFISTCMSQNVVPKDTANLEALKTILSTGSPLLPDHFRWVYEKVKSNVHLSSISGGTDIISCFMLGNPLMPVHAGEIQYAGLGMAVEAWRSHLDDATSLRQVTRGEKGELVCTKPFVSMPIGFWNDANGRKYRRTYFDFYPNQSVWRHGDFIQFSPSGGIVVYGRSDATLNPGGVRIGTAELYRAVESLDFVEDSLAVSRAKADDVEILLFVKTCGRNELDNEHIQAIKQHIRKQLSPRHVPAKVIAVHDIPYTRSGKKVEIAVSQILANQPVQNKSALANPDCLSEYENLDLS